VAGWPYLVDETPPASLPAVRTGGKQHLRPDMHGVYYDNNTNKTASAAAAAAAAAAAPPSAAGKKPMVGRCRLTL